MYKHATLLLTACLALTACQRSTYEVWEDTKTCSRHLGKGFNSLCGVQGDSRAVMNPDEFYVQDDYGYNSAPIGQDFVPLEDMNGTPSMPVSEMAVPQPRETPGDPGSSIPGIEAFRDPSTDRHYSNIFRNVHFDYNSHLVKGENADVVHRVADYMKAHPGLVIFVEGHCDERGPEAFNLALGARRANGVRSMLISLGVDPDRIFTISYGKERPLLLDHHEEAWAQNRRAEFKIYQR